MRISIIAFGSTVLSFLSIASAHAQVSEDILEELRTFQPSQYCEERENGNERQCMLDVQKALRRFQYDFSQALRVEKREWQKEYRHLGIGKEYRDALNVYLGSVNERMKLFREYTTTLQKAFYTMRSSVRENTVQQPRGITRAIRSSEVQVSDRCSSIVEASSKRMCIRLELRLVNVEAIKRGVYGNNRNAAEDTETMEQ